ncbi:MAG: glutamate--tRNA ligase [Fimbriimonadales bacterium]|nr:glutamate--tRNA ligase [Fimbriimonadales bacterium]
MSVRVRFAPSPTGLLHVGALRDALFKYLFARHCGGQNILRIEDTDRNRYNPDSEREFIETLRWVGIDFDEGPHVGGPCAPYRQSERKEAGIYEPYVRRLLEEGHAYKAFDTPEELAAMREHQMANKLPVGYFGGEWRDAPASRVEAAEREGRPCVIRQRIPRGTTIAIDDAIRGRIEWDSDQIDDPVLIKADGMPTYHFAAMVDDHLMGITHILRGEEWISSAPKHALLFDMFGWERPVFVHCPVIVGNDGKKLSKRHGATRVLDYMAQGFLPAALKNFVALIGWSPGDDREGMSEEELIEAFTLEGLQPSPGRFDLEKLRWLNGWHIRRLSIPQFVEAFRKYAREPYVRQYWTEVAEPQPESSRVSDAVDRMARVIEEQPSYAERIFALAHERTTVLPDVTEVCGFFTEDEPAMDPKAVAKWLQQPHAAELFNFLLENLPRMVDEAACESVLREFAEAKGFEKLGPVVHPTRVALTGKTAGPGLFELMAVLGPERMERRLRRALELASGAS